MFDHLEGPGCYNSILITMLGAHRSLFPEDLSVYSLIDHPTAHVLAIARKVLAKHATIPSLDLPRWRFFYIRMDPMLKFGQLSEENGASIFAKHVASL